MRSCFLVVRAYGQPTRQPVCDLLLRPSPRSPCTFLARWVRYRPPYEYPPPRPSDRQQRDAKGESENLTE